MGKYSKAMGFDEEQYIATALTLDGVGRWAVGKLPAVLGGYIADYAYTAVVKRFHTKESKWVPETIGTVGTVVVAFGIQYAGARFMPDSTHFLDKLTDGLCGRMSPAIMNTAKRLLGMTPSAAANANLSLDGDDGAMRQVAALMHASPDFLATLADGMVDVMSKNDVDLDGGTKPELVRSMREVARQLSQAA